ncbi:MAG: class I SAM-dependent methyltransferase [Bacteroidales bacterium]
MSEFDARAREWDKNKMHTERSEAIASGIRDMIVLNPSMKALEFGAGTGILSFMLSDEFSDITMMDSSSEMIQVCVEKAEKNNSLHIHPLYFDLEHNDFEGRFDIIYNQMVLHHVADYETMFAKFYTLLNTEGYLAIADLFPEDGSFHGDNVNVHLGFDPEILSRMLRNSGFSDIRYINCYNLKHESGKIFPIFLLVAKK